MRFALILSAFASLVNLSPAYAGPYHFPDKISCELDSQGRYGYFDREVEISFPELKVPGRFSLVGDVKLTILSASPLVDNTEINWKSVPIKIQTKDFAHRLDHLVVKLSATSSISIKAVKDGTVISARGLNNQIPDLSKAECLFLDGSLAKPGLSGSN